MDYKEKYEQALDRASKLRVQNPFDTVGQMVEHIFPELKENEDERIRKWIINDIRYNMDNETLENSEYKKQAKKALAWLEKQGEQKSAESTKDYNDIDPHFGIIVEDLMSTDKTEPKFKVGDWIIFNGLILHIDEVVNGYYRTTSIGDGIHNSYDWDIDNAARLWTIQDAKDGDVLINWNNTTFIFRAIEDGTVKFHVAYNERLNTIATPLTKLSHQGLAKPEFEFRPASKEQCDTLFAKMKKAGYKWDSEKKELKKIEPKTIDADKVIAWLKNTIYERVENYGVYNETHLILPYNSIEDLINDFKEDFRL